MNVRPTRLLLTSNNLIASVRTEMLSTKPKAPTHYETLEVNPRATQGEIKSAYFKLSKQYHPDKNSSEAATAKFRDIADAYAVVGNYETRRTYDRSILTRTRHQTTQSGDKPDDPKMKYYQSQAALYRQTTKTGSVPLYDFDAWAKAHYGETFSRSQQQKQTVSRLQEERSHNRKIQEKSGTRDVVIVLSVFGLITMWTISANLGNQYEHDRPLTMRQRDRLRESEDGNKSQEFPLVRLSSE